LTDSRLVGSFWAQPYFFVFVATMSRPVPRDLLTTPPRCDFSSMSFSYHTCYVVVFMSDSPYVGGWRRRLCPPSALPEMVAFHYALLGLMSKNFSVQSSIVFLVQRRSSVVERTIPPFPLS